MFNVYSCNLVVYVVVIVFVNGIICIDVLLLDIKGGFSMFIV